MRDYDLIPFRTLLDQVVVPARRHVGRILLPVAVPIMTGGVAVTVAQALWFETLFAADPDEMGAGFCFGAVAYMGLALAFLVVYFLAFAVLVVAATDAMAGRTLSMGRCWLYVLRPQVLWTLFLLGLAYMVSFMMCFLPALYVVPLLTFVLPAMVDEELDWSQAFGRSVELALFNPTGRWTHHPLLQAFVLLFVGFVFNYAISFAVQGPFAIAQQIVLQREAFTGQAPDMQAMRTAMWLQVPGVALGSLATAVSWLYTAFGSVILFREVRRRKEAPDLEDAIGRLTAAS